LKKWGPGLPLINRWKYSFGLHPTGDLKKIKNALRE